MNVTEAVLALVAVVVVAVIAYRAGYLQGQAELLRQGQPTEAEWNAMRMKPLLPRWRGVAGWALYVFSGLLLCLFMFLAYRYARGWGWTFLMAAWVSVVRHLHGRDLARRVVLEAPPRGRSTRQQGELCMIAGVGVAVTFSGPRVTTEPR
jgi:hypothetical protein